MSQTPFFDPVWFAKDVTPGSGMTCMHTTERFMGVDLGQQEKCSVIKFTHCQICGKINVEEIFEVNIIKHNEENTTKEA